MSKTAKPIAPESLLKDADYSKASQFDKNFRQIRTLNDPRFGDIHILQNPQSRQVVAVREKKITDKAETGRQIIAARNRLALKNPYLVNLLDYSVTKQSELCSSFYIIKYYFEYPRTDLRKYYLDKEKAGQGLNSAELTNILYQQSQALGYLQSQGTAHGDLQPLYIGWDPEKQESRLIDKSESLTNDAAIIQAQKNRLISGQPLYMSPTLFSNLKKGNTKFQFDRNKEDSFALGLLLLEAGNGHSIQNIYDAKAGQINQGALSQHIDEFNRKFGGQNSLLVSHVSSLLNTNEAARPSPVQVQGSLPPFEEVKSRLVNSQAVDFGVVPSGINQSTRKIVTGGDTREKIVTEVKMPEVQEDLFAFDQIKAPAHAEAAWDPSIVQPPTIYQAPQLYNFVAPPKVNAPPPQTYSAPAEHNLFDELPAENTIFNTFGSQQRNRVAAKPVANSVYGNQNNQWQVESAVDSQYNDFQGGFQGNFQRKVHGENITGADQPLPPQQAPAPAPAPVPAPAVAQTVSQTQVVQQPTVATTQVYTTGYTQPAGDILPVSFRRSVSSASHSSIQHEFRLYDSTLTQPEVISGGSYVSPVNTSASTASYSYTNLRPSSQGNVISKPVTTTVTYESPVRTSYYQAAPLTTYTTYSQNQVPATQTVTYTSRPSQLVYANPSVVEAPVQSYVYSDAGAPRIRSSQVIQTTAPSANLELNGLKYVGSYYDDSKATIKNI